MRRLAVVLSAGLLTPAHVMASDGGAPAAPFPAPAELVKADVAVTDRDGRPVGDLAQDDFTLLDEGARQTITTFEKVQPPPASAPAASAVEGFSSRAAVTTNVGAAADAARSFAIVLDDVHWSPGMAGRAKG